MARPALSASRTTEMLDLFAAFPGRSFTMSEIMRATDINVSSCHAILAALTARGYLEKREKHYRLGRALLAVGNAAEATHPLVARAEDAARTLNKTLETAVLLSTVAGDEILALASFPDAQGRSARLQAGQRVPLIPPNGAHFLAWSSDEQIDAWIARSHDPEPAEVQQWRDSLALTRERGFQVTLRREQTPEFSELFAKMAVGRQSLAYRSEASLVVDHGWTLAQPETIDPDAAYDVALIAAPIFDEAGEAMFSLALGGFSEPLAGARIAELADRLLASCLTVMREERGV